MIGPLTKRAKLSETRESINAAADSVIGFAAANNRLPTIAEFPTVVRTPNDAWGRAFLYVPATLYVNALPTTVICNSTSTDTAVKICSDVSCTPAVNTMNNAAFIIISAGPDVINHTGTATPFTTWPPGFDVNGNPNDEIVYDDIGKWVTLPELQTKIACESRLYEFWNLLGVRAWFNLNGNGCFPVDNDTYIGSIGRGGVIRAFTDSNCTAPATPASLTYSLATAADANGNMVVNYSNPIADR